MEKRVQFDLNSLIRKNILEMEPYSSARDEYKDSGEELIFLNANENPFENGLNRYPDPQQEILKSALGQSKNVKVVRILLGNGSDEILDLIFRAFCKPGEDNIITLPPTYGMYKVLARLNDVEEKEVLLKQDFQPDPDAIFSAVNEKTKIIFLCSPNNPTGNSLSQATIEKILSGFNGLVVIDEAYIDFSDSESWLEKLDLHPNLIVTQTFSKAMGMAGIRIGIAYASEEIIKILNKIKPPYNVSTLSQNEAIKRLENPEQISSEIEKIKKQRKYLENELNGIDFIQKVYPSDANFLLVKCDDARRRYDQLLKEGIVVRNRSTQPLCENTLRISIGTEKENRELLQKMQKL